MTNKSLAVIVFVLLMGAAAYAIPPDSLRVELREGKKFIIHRVVKGETLPAIAAMYGVEEADITNSNALITANVFTGQVIKIPLNTKKYGNVEVKPITALTDSRMPLAKTLPPPVLTRTAPQQIPVPSTPEVKPVVIETPESKNEVAIKDTVFPVATEQIQEPVKPARRLTKQFQTYVVASPQTVKQLAINFDVEVEDVIAINTLKNYRLKEGQKVKIPIYEDMPLVKVKPAFTEPPPVVIAEVPKPPPVVVKNNSAPVRIAPLVVKKDPVVVNDPVVVAKVDSQLITPVMPVEPIAIVKVEPIKTEPAAVITPPKVMPQPVKAITIKEPVYAEPTTFTDTSYMVDTSFHGHKTLAMLAGAPDHIVDKHDSVYVHPDNIYYKINDYKRADYFYDAWAIKAANANAVYVNTTNQSQGAGDKNFTHIVKPGETIQSIAKKYKIGVSDLANWNGLFQYRVRVGQELTVNAARADLNEFERAELPANDKQNGTIIKEEVKVGIAYYNPKAPLKGVYCDGVQKGKIIYILNRENFMEYYGRVVGPLPKKVPANTILQIDSEVANKLHIKNPTINIEIWYGIIE